jgi:hypothetical protein
VETASSLSKIGCEREYNFSIYHNKCRKNIPRLLGNDLTSTNQEDCEGLFELLSAKDVRMWEVYQKYRASVMNICFRDYLNSKCRSKGISEDWVGKIRSRYSINNQKATLTYYLVFDAKGECLHSDVAYDLENFIEIGIQIEDVQYRRFVDGEHSRRVFDKLKNDSSHTFFSNSWRNRKKKDHNYYKPHFIYQYDKPEEGAQFLSCSPQPYENIFEQVLRDLSYLNGKNGDIAWD